LYLNTLADILFAQQKYTKAAETWILAIKTDEMSVNSYLGLAKAYLKSKSLEKAEKYSRLYLLMFKNDEEAIAILSESLALQGDCMGALKVLNTMPDKNAAFYRSRGIIYLQSDTYQFAIDDFNRAIDLDHTLFDIYLHRGLAYYMLGKKDDAKRDWNTAVKNRVYKANDYLEKYR
ncbi:MAG: tetratricopeptide repeat protein, partial [Bacteroidales bacterium]|nr:tetratricopeptide repeat protein [Bacteroidales bacterium]